jgi:hypothetical protein
MPDADYNWMALPEFLRGLFQRRTHYCPVQIPKHCGKCGRMSAGNWLTGYYLPCLLDGTHGDMLGRLGTGVLHYTRFLRSNDGKH